MAKRDAITAEYVRSILNYNPDTGIFTWRERDDVPKEWNRRWAGTIAGTPNDSNYLLISINKQHHRAHRLAWLWMTGKWPDPECDHRDTVRANNRWSNLREATRSQNAANTSIQRNNTSGFKGVYWNKIVKKWWAHITKDGRRHSLGYFDDIDEAVAVVTRERLKHHGEYARAG